MSEQDDFYLYHYTTPEGLVRIIEHQGIWATNIFFLNDFEEWYLGMKLFKDGLQGRINSKANNSIFKKCLGAVKSAISSIEPGGLMPEKNLAMYVCSFSKEDDLLSQWRAYCPRGGFALGFLKSKLESLAREQDFTFEPCIYKHEDQIRKVDEILNRMKTEALERDQQANEADIINKFIWDIFRASVLLKHVTFSEECEWRFAPTLQSTGKPKKLGFCTREGLIVPHRVIDLSDPDFWKDVTIVVGPSPHKDKCVNAVRTLCEERKIWCKKIRTSKIPYRYW